MPGTPTGAPQIDGIIPSVTGVATTPANADLRVGQVVTFTVALSEAVTVTGVPTLSLNDGGSASYSAGSGSNTLTFVYTVASGQNVADLAVTGTSLPPGASITDIAGNAADLSGATGSMTDPVQIDTVTPAVASVSVAAAGADLGAGQVVTFTLNFNEAVSVAGTPALSLNDGGTASYVSGSGSNALTFSYTVATGQNTPALAVTGASLTGGASIADGAGNAADLSGAIGPLAGAPQIDTVTPTVTSVVAAPASGTFNAGKIVTLTVTFSEAVFVAGAPVLKLNDGGSATYVAGSGGNTLTFSYTVLAGQNTAALATTGITLPTGASITDGAGNAANLAGAKATLPGTVAPGTVAPGTVAIDTTPPAVTEKLVSDTGWSATDLVTSNPALKGTGDANAVVTLTENGKVVGTTTASSTGAWTDTPTGLANGPQTIVASETDAAGNTGTASLTFTLDTARPVVTAIAAAPANADLGTGQVITFTVSLSEAVRVTGTPTLTLNDGGSASYSGGSGSNTLTFKYTVASGQNTADLAVTGTTLPGSATITDIAGNAASLSGAIGSLPGRIVVDTTDTRTAISSGNGKTVNAGSGKDVVVLSAGSDSLAFKGSSDIAFLGGGSGAVNATISDASSGLTVYVLNAGKDVFSGFGADPSAVVDLLGGIGGYASAAAVLAALTPYGSGSNGGLQLSLGSGQYIDFAGLAPGALHASNFVIG